MLCKEVKKLKEHAIEKNNQCLNYLNTYQVRRMKI